MAGATLEQDIDLIIEDIGGGGGKPPRRHGGDDDSDAGGGKRNEPEPTQPSARRYYAGVVVAILSILMFFLALGAAFIVRRVTGGHWIPLRIPAILWGNTVVLLASSFTLELARRRLANADVSGFRALWTITTLLGLLFLAGQILAWRQLEGQGIFVASNPGSSFFYIFTGLHGLHLLGGVAALAYVAVRKFATAKITRPVAARMAAYYWHFMNALWLFLLALLAIGAR